VLIDSEVIWGFVVDERERGISDDFGGSFGFESAVI
jgi:hypothetical protein